MTISDTPSVETLRKAQFTVPKLPSSASTSIAVTLSLYKSLALTDTELVVIASIKFPLMFALFRLMLIARAAPAPLVKLICPSYTTEGSDGSTYPPAIVKMSDALTN